MSYKKSIVVGAIIGFAVAMTKRQERKAFKEDSKLIAQQIKFIYDHPVNVINELRRRLTQINDRTVTVIDQLNQLESLFNKDHKKM